VRVWHESELEGLVPIRVLVGIPHLITPGEQERVEKKVWIERGAAAAMFILMLAGNLYVFLKG
jgi:hypothetical protein